METQIYLEEKVLEAIREAYYSGIDDGGFEYGDEAFDAHDYLPEPIKIEEVEYPEKELS